jgi:hypothetical protein
MGFVILVGNKGAGGHPKTGRNQYNVKIFSRI